MGKFWLTIIILILIAIGAGGIYLMTVDIDPPQNHIEKTLPNDRSPQ